MSNGLRMSVQDAERILGKRAAAEIKRQVEGAGTQSLSGKSAKPSGSPARKKHKGEIEGDEQVELIDCFRERYPEYAALLIHIPNGGSRKNKFEGWRLKRQGVRKGVSDLLLPVARNGYHGLWIEFKAAPPNDSPVTDEQVDWLEMMTEQGYKAELCKGVVEALRVIDKYLEETR